MIIKYSDFKSLLHDGAALNEESQVFFSNIEKELGTKIERTELDDYDCDLKLIYIETGGSEGLFLKNIESLKEPYYFLTSGSHNSLAATLEILTYLNNRGKKCEAIHGSSEYIASRINELALVSSMKKKLTGCKLGVIGEPSDWLIASIPSYDDVEKKLGIEIEDIEISELERRYSSDRSGYKMDIEGCFDAMELEKANKVYSAIKEIVRDHNLDGFTIRCFDLLSSIKMTSCLALSQLNDEGVVSTCEGDISAMLSMLIAARLGDGFSFQANPSRIDTVFNKVVFAHCTIPTRMLGSYKLDTHFESGTGVAVAGELKNEPVTVFRISSDLKRYFVSEGVIESSMHENSLCRTQILVSLEDPAIEMLTHPCGNHHVIFYGRHKKEIEVLMKELLLLD